MNIFIGLLGLVISFLIVIYRYGIIRLMGKIEWAEVHLGSGGTYTFLLIFGFFLFIISLMILTGTLGFLLNGFTDIFFGSFG